MKLTQLIALLFIALSGLAQAHSYHAVRTQVQLNETTGKVEIIHRAFVADIGALLSQEKGQKHDVTTADEAWIQAYWNRYFGLLNANGKPLSLEWVGFEAEHHDLWVYQEYSGTLEALIKAQLHNGLLFGHFEHQTNTVDVNIGDRKAALIFTETQTKQSLLPAKE